MTIPIEVFLEFLEIYKNRPILDNHHGMRAQGMFFLWYLLKKINPGLVIESGVWRGGSSWMIDQAAPHAKYIAIDPELDRRVYHSKRATYFTTDFAYLSLDTQGPVVAFFDDHQDAFRRVLQAAEKGVKHLIFDDNYPPDAGDGTPHFTLASCFALEDYREEADVLRTFIKSYHVFPQVIGSTATHLAWIKNTFTDIPALWKNLHEVDPLFREQMRVFSDDSVWYRWMTYVELH